MVLEGMALVQPGNIAAVSSSAMVSTDHPLATAAALDMLRRGGSAADGYVAAAAVQAVLMPPMTSIAGGLGMSWFDAASGRTTLVAGDFRRPAAEPGDWDEAGADGGRPVAAPGWLNGANAAWRRFGRLGWSELFEHAVAHARDGFVIYPKLWGWMYQYRYWMARFPEGQRIWYPDGQLLNVGERLVQADLAHTLEQVQADPELRWFHEGDFAERYVAAAQAQGGRITMDDMAQHRGQALVQDAAPLGTYRGHDIHAPGATVIALALQAAEHGNLRDLGAPLDNPETLYRQMRLVEETWHEGLRRGTADKVQIDAENTRAPTSEQVASLWRRVTDDPSRPYDPITPGTNALVVADGHGNVTFGAHSVSSRPFGSGLLVDGVVVCRPMRIFGQPVVRPVGLANAMLLAKDGRAALALASPTASHATNILQVVMNILEFGIEPAPAVTNPRFGVSLPPSRRAMIEGNFPERHYAALRARGMDFQRVSPFEGEVGSCQLVRMRTGALDGVADPRRPGKASGL